MSKTKVSKVAPIKAPSFNVQDEKEDIEQLGNDETQVMDKADIADDALEQLSIPAQISEADTQRLPKPEIPLKIFLQINGQKWDQTAGFKHYAKKNKLEPLTVDDWRKAYQAFMEKPTE